MITLIFVAGKLFGWWHVSWWWILLCLVIDEEAE